MDLLAGLSIRYESELGIITGSSNSEAGELLAPPRVAYLLILSLSVFCPWSYVCVRPIKMRRAVK